MKSAAARLAAALARHLALGGGVSERSIADVADAADVLLRNGPKHTDDGPMVRCARCKRWIVHPISYRGGLYGSTCVTRVRPTLEEPL